MPVVGVFEISDNTFSTEEVSWKDADVVDIDFVIIDVVVDVVVAVVVDVVVFDIVVDVVVDVLVDVNVVDVNVDVVDVVVDVAVVTVVDVDFVVISFLDNPFLTEEVSWKV